jgi:hypothetical protein
MNAFAFPLKRINSSILLLGKPFMVASVTLAPPCSCSPEKATMALNRLLRSFKYASNASLYWIARLMPLVTTIARACPPTFSLASTCSWKWSIMISAFWRMA